MSVESLLLLVVLIVLPLLERLVRFLRARTPQRRETATADAPPPAAASAVLAPASAPPPLHPPAERVSAAERVHRSRETRAAAVTRGINQPSLPRKFALRNRAEARRAMLLVAILGPCKGLEREGGSLH